MARYLEVFLKPVNTMLYGIRKWITVPLLYHLHLVEMRHISTENEGVIDDYYRQMEIEANKADKRKGAK